MRKLFFILFVLAELTSFAQKTEKIEYYTDSDVRRSIVSVQLGYMPYYSNRRILAESANPQAGYYFVNSTVTGGFGQAYGGDLMFKLTQNFEFGVGVYNSFANYSWDAVQLIDAVNGNGDTLNGSYEIFMKANYLNIPIQFGFVTQVADQWYLQVYPAMELNFLQKLDRTYDITDPDLIPENTDLFGDITDIGTDFNLTVNFGLGAEYRVTDKIGLFTRLQFRYMFFEVVPDAPIREVIYTVGGHFGARFYF
jgi:hypothetical protein